MGCQDEKVMGADDKQRRRATNKIFRNAYASVEKREAERSEKAEKKLKKFREKMWRAEMAAEKVITTWAITTQAMTI